MEEKKRNEIMMFGLSAEEMQKVMKASPESIYIYAEDWQDIVAVSADLVIANPDAINEEGQEVIAEYYKEIEPSPESLILTNRCNELTGIKSIEIYENLFLEENILRTTILRCLRETANDVGFSRRIMISLKVMKYICNHPGISTKELALAVEVSERSIKRYIETLRMAGADIIFENKGWKCELALWDI